MSSRDVPMPRDLGPLDPACEQVLAAQVAAIIRRWTEGEQLIPNEADVAGELITSMSDDPDPTLR
jgi:hypothetical protein